MSSSIQGVMRSTAPSPRKKHIVPARSPIPDTDYIKAVHMSVKSIRNQILHLRSLAYTILLSSGLCCLVLLAGLGVALYLEYIETGIWVLFFLICFAVFTIAFLISYEILEIAKKLRESERKMTQRFM